MQPKVKASSRIYFVIAALLLVLIVAIATLLVLDPSVLSETTIKKGDVETKIDRAKIWLGIAAIIGIILASWRSYTSHRQAEAAIRQAAIASENHVTGIFAKSVELLGLTREITTPLPDGKSTTRSVPNIESRLGALYSLERLLTESLKDQRAILETLSAYIRENSPLEIPDDEAERSVFLRGHMPPSSTRRADVQAAITILGRRSAQLRKLEETNRWRINLKSCNLVGYDFSNLNFDRADFSGSFLNGANFNNSIVRDSIFENVFMHGAKFTDARFDSALFDDCEFNRAEINNTNFQLATFKSVELSEANVISFNIKGANLLKAYSDFSLDYTLKALKIDRVDEYYFKDAIKLRELFRKAETDDQTQVSQAVHDILIIMNEALAAHEASAKAEQV